MIKLKEILNEITNALPPPPIVQQSTNNTQQFSPDFIKYIKIVEYYLYIHIYFHKTPN